MATTILIGDVLDGLACIEDSSVQCCVTSPPYYGLRDYGVAGQIGLEETPEAYVEKMVAVFREVRRTLRDDGTLWLNIGDSFCNIGHAKGNRGNGIAGNGHRNSEGNYQKGHGSDRKNKDLIGIPWMLAFALRSDGWYLRSDIVWTKPNAMPESVKDRPTSSHEYVFLLTKSARYFYDAAAVSEPVTHPRKEGANAYRGQAALRPRAAGERIPSTARNLRDVWSISTKPFRQAHFAVMPEALAKTCIKAGSAPGSLVLDPFMGAGTVGLVANQLGREAVGCELNPGYVAIIRKRLEDSGQHVDMFYVGNISEAAD